MLISVECWMTEEADDCGRAPAAAVFRTVCHDGDGPDRPNLQCSRSILLARLSRLLYPAARWPAKCRWSRPAARSPARWPSGCC